MQQNINIDGTIVKLHIWDTGGSDRFRSLVSMYYRDAIAAIICYDLTSENSFKSVNYWAQEMQEKNNMSTFVVALAGNKCDIEKEKHEIKQEMISEFVKSQTFEPENLI